MKKNSNNIKNKVKHKKIEKQKMESESLIWDKGYRKAQQNVPSMKHLAAVLISYVVYLL